MYVVVKGGEKVIDNVYCLLVCKCCGDIVLLELLVEQICQQMLLVVLWVMIEGLLYDE